MTPEEEDLVRSYRVLFASPAGQAVMLDLMKFCKFRVPVDSQIDEGQRRVFLRIMSMSMLTDQQLAQLYRGQAPRLEDEDG